MNKQKETATHDFIAMIKKSWTWGRMTENEKRNCVDLFFSTVSEDAIVGNYLARWRVCQAVYNAYLIGIGYDGWNWRQTTEHELIPTF